MLRSGAISSLIAVTSRLPSSPLATAARLLDKLVLFGKPRPRPVLERVDRDSMTDHRRESLRGVSSMRDLVEVAAWVSSLSRISTGEAGTGSSDGVRAATVLPPETRLALGVRYPNDGCGFFLGVCGMNGTSRSSNRCAC